MRRVQRLKTEIENSKWHITNSENFLNLSTQTPQNTNLKYANGQMQGDTKIKTKVKKIPAYVNIQFIRKYELGLFIEPLLENG